MHGGVASWPNSGSRRALRLVARVLVARALTSLRARLAPVSLVRVQGSREPALAQSLDDLVGVRLVLLEELGAAPRASLAGATPDAEEHALLRDLFEQGVFVSECDCRSSTSFAKEGERAIAGRSTSL